MGRKVQKLKGVRIVKRWKVETKEAIRILKNNISKTEMFYNLYRRKKSKTPIRVKDTVK